MSIYNPLKLSAYRELFNKKTVLLLGTGAVGSSLAEALIKMGTSAVMVDLDQIEASNLAKSSGVIRFPEDLGRSKARCLSERLQPLLDDGCRINGICGNLCELGPEAIAAFDCVFLSLDNFAAKVAFNRVWLSLPPQRRPPVIMSGTSGELAQSVLLSGRACCLECLMDESWMKDSSVRTSCVGPQFRTIDGVPQIVRTSGLASSIAANLAAEQFRALVMGHTDALEQQITYTAFPMLELMTAAPLPRANCPGCKGTTVDRKVRKLSGCVMDLTLQNALDQLKQALGTDKFELAVHRLEYKNVLHSAVLLEHPCLYCGQPLSVMAHESRLFRSDLLCPDCKAAGRTPDNAPSDSCSMIHAFSPDSDSRLMGMTLHQLGYPLGAHLEVLLRGNSLDLLDPVSLEYFTCSDDPARLFTISEI